MKTFTQEQMEKHIPAYLRYVKNQYEDEKIVCMLDPQFVCCDVAARSLTLRFQVKPWMLNVGGTMHGGLIATAFDTAFGTLTHFYSQPHFITTTNLSVTYLEPVFESEAFDITVVANRVGRTLAGLSAELRIADHRGRLCDTATATFMILHEEFLFPEE